MLFVTGSLNGTPISLLVDSGSTHSLFSDSLVSKCNIRHLVDNRILQDIYGVGHDKTIGKVQRAPLFIGDIPITTPFMVMKTELKHVLIGVDFLSSYQVIVFQLNKIKLTVSYLYPSAKSTWLATNWSLAHSERRCLFWPARIILWKTVMALFSHMLPALPK